jgi:hypothetical protein
MCRLVDGEQGYKVLCGGVSCIFEFEAYEFCDTESDDSDADSLGASPNGFENVDGGARTVSGDGGVRTVSVDGGVRTVSVDGGAQTVSVDMEPQGETSTCSAGTGFDVCKALIFATGEEIILRTSMLNVL